MIIFVIFQPYLTLYIPGRNIVIKWPMSPCDLFAFHSGNHFQKKLCMLSFCPLFELLVYSRFPVSDIMIILTLQVSDRKPVEWGEQCWGIHRCAEEGLSLCGMWVCWFVIIIIVIPSWPLVGRAKHNLFLFPTQQVWLSFCVQCIWYLDMGTRDLIVLRWSVWTTYLAKTHTLRLIFYLREIDSLHSNILATEACKKNATFVREFCVYKILIFYNSVLQWVFGWLAASV